MNLALMKRLFTALLFFIQTLIYAQGDFSSINPGIEIISIVDSSHPMADELAKAIKNTSYQNPDNSYSNSIQTTVFVTDQSIKTKEGVEDFLGSRKVSNELLAFLLNETNDTINNQRMLERAKKELTQLQYESLLRRGADEASLLKQMSRLVDYNFFVVYKYSEIKQFEVTDTTYNSITNKFKIEKKKGVTARLDKYIIKPNLSEFVLNNEFYEKGYTYSGSQYSKEEITNKKSYRDNLDIPIKVLGSENEDIKSYTVLSSNSFNFNSLSDPQKDSVKAASSKVTKTERYKARSVKIFKGGTDIEKIVVALKDAPAKSDFEKLIPYEIIQKKGYVTETASERSGKVAKKDRGIRVNLGKDQGLRTNHRYKFVRSVQNPKTGIIKDKIVGSGLATRYIPQSTRGKDNLGKTSQFKQIYGGKIRQFDRALEDRILGTFYGGYGDMGLKLMMDFYLRGKVGRKFYFDFGYDIDGMTPDGFNNGVTDPEGNVLSVDMDVTHLGMGFAREYYLNRFYAGYHLGLRLFDATFSQDVEEILIPEDEKYYAYDISWEVGINAGVRVTKDFALNIHASAMNANFNNPFDGDERDIPEYDYGTYNSNISFSVSYTIPYFRKNEVTSEKKITSWMNKLTN